MRQWVVLIIAVSLFLSGCEHLPVVTTADYSTTVNSNSPNTGQITFSNQPTTSMAVSSVTPPVLSTSSAPVFFFYSGTGITGSPPFESDWSYWLITYSTDWDGIFTLELKTGKTGHIVVDQSVTAGKVYQSCVIGYTGSPFFVALHAPDDGNWTIQVEPDPSHS